MGLSTSFLPAFVFLLFAVSFGLITHALKLRGHEIPRLSGLIVVTALLLSAVAFIAPVKIPVLLFKLVLITIAGIVGYLLDCLIFPYARPDSYLAFPNWKDAVPKVGDANCPVVSGYRLTFNAAMQRRAIIVGCAMLASALGA